LESSNFARDALAEILPTLLELLTTQEEDEDEEDWTKAMAAASCLELLAQNVGDPIVPTVVQFVEGNIRGANWQQREAAVMAFGSVLEGPDATVLGPLVNQALGTLISMLSTDSSMAVQDTVAWTLSKITEVVLEVIDPNVHLNSMVAALLEGLPRSPRICNSCCSALGNLVTQLSGGGLGSEAPTTSMMSSSYPAVLTALMPLSDKPTNDNNSRSAAYQTISAFVASAPQDMFQVVHEVAMEMINRQERYIAAQNQLVGADDRQNWNNVQSSICTVIQAAINRNPQMTLQNSDRIMNNLAQIIQSPARGAGVVEDSFAVVGEIASNLEGGFAKYLEPFSGFLFAALEALEDSHVTQAGVYLVSDISRSVNEAFAPYAERILQRIVNILRSPVVSREVKPSAITAIGEIGMAIGSGFVPYLSLIMEILSQAGATTADSNDMAMIEFVWTMRESIVDSFIGIMNGLKIGDRTSLFCYQYNS
jgi:importin subunit beta-1